MCPGCFVDTSTLTPGLREAAVSALESPGHAGTSGHSRHARFLPVLVNNHTALDRSLLRCRRTVDQPYSWAFRDRNPPGDGAAASHTISNGLHESGERCSLLWIQSALLLGLIAAVKAEPGPTPGMDRIWLRKGPCTTRRRGGPKSAWW